MVQHFITQKANRKLKMKSYPQQAPSTIAMQNASVNEVFRNISPWFKTCQKMNARQIKCFKFLLQIKLGFSSLWPVVQILDYLHVLEGSIQSFN